MRKFWQRREAAAVERRPVVLLAEDDPDMREMTELILRQRGFDVLAAENAATAMLTCRVHRGVIDVLLTDLEMPGVSGGELARSVKGQRPGMAVVYLSGVPKHLAVGRRSVEPDSIYLTKPYSADVLVSTIGRAIGASAGKS